VLKTFGILIMKKLAIFDKDGTLVSPKRESAFVQDPEDQILLPGVSQGLSAMASEGWVFAIASNQGGVAAGYKTLTSMTDEMFEAMEMTGINVAMAAHSYDPQSAIYLAKHNQEKQWLPVAPVDYSRPFRKPNSGMIDFLIESYGGDLEVLFVGDRPKDQQAAQNAGVSFQWADDWRKQYVK
jgi:D-glycero-D-manno-heptose 1,7-bisphosphate phosphatase